MDKISSPRWLAVLRVTCGNFLEMFDFFLFGLYAPHIAAAFFPAGNETASLMQAFAVFGAGFLMRPLGAIILGAYVDSLGRRKGLMVTLGIMAIGTMMIALLPGYDKIGLAAPLLALAGRLLQGFSAGVELGGVSVYLAEMAPKGRRGFFVAWQSASQQLAIIVAAGLGFALNRWMSASDIAAGGWRLPFLVGCLLVPFLFYVRRSLEETKDFLARRHPALPEILRSVAGHWRLMLLGMMLVTMTTVSFYMTTVYTPTFGKSVLKLSNQDALLVTILVAVTNFIWNPVGGALSDRIGRKPVLLTIACLSLVTSYPALHWLVADPTFGKMLAVEMMLSFYFGVYSGTMLGALVEVVPTHVRTTCFSLAFALAAGLFGTFTPFASTLLIEHTGDKASPGFWLMFGAVLGIIATLAVYRGGKAMAAQEAVAASG